MIPLSDAQGKSDYGGCGPNNHGRLRCTAGLEDVGPLFSQGAVSEPAVSDLLDLRALACQPLPEANVKSWIARMELDLSAERVSQVVRGSA